MNEKRTVTIAQLSRLLAATRALLASTTYIVVPTAVLDELREAVEEAENAQSRKAGQ